MIESQFSAETCTASERYKKILGLAREELELLQQAVFTEPDDQTAWWYHRFIVASFMEPLPELSWVESVEDVEPYMELLQEEAGNMRELIEAEDRQHLPTVASRSLQRTLNATGAQQIRTGDL